MAADQTASGEITRRSVIQLTSVAQALPVAQFHPIYLENGLMPFTPKFVDLVRNFTTVQGTGPITLGAAVSGYESLGQVLTTGDRFYYCLQGVDKPQEREVGRGTLQADGRVTREPISGGLTNFSSGTKTIALVTAAEWFSKVETVGSGGMLAVADRAELAAKSTGRAFLAEPYRAGNFVFDPANHSAKVAVDPRQGIFVAPGSDPTGASGAWIRQFDAGVNVRWFGATGDGTTNDGAAFVAALALLKILAGNADGWNKGSTKLSIPAGHYFLGTTTLDISHSLIVEGDQGYSPGPATKLRWAAGATGIRIQYYNTSGAGNVDVVPQGSGGGAHIRNLFLQGAYTNMASEGEYHGVHAKVAFLMDECWVTGFQGDGLRIAATAGGGAPNEGNANVCRVSNCRIVGNRCGVLIDGADTNACLFSSVDVSDNRTWGIDDSSFLGNTHIAHHAANNGLGENITPTMVSYGGNRFTVKAGQATAASTNAPPLTATDNSWWVYVSAGNAFAALSIVNWTNGITVREGGPYKTDNANAANLFLNCYSEVGAPAQFVAPTITIGGALAVSGTAARMRSYAGQALFDALMVAGHAVLAGASNSIGAQAGTGADSSLYLDNDNAISEIAFRCKGVRTGRLLANHPYGILFDAEAGKAFYVNNNNQTTCTIDGNGIDIASDKALKVDGTKVIGTQGAAVANASGGSTIDAEARASLNDLLSRLRTHGLIAS